MIDSGKSVEYHPWFATTAQAEELRKVGSITDKQKLKHYRNLLETRRCTLLESVARSEEDGRTAHEVDSAQNIADRASNSYEKEFLFARSNNDRQFVRLVELAMSHLAERTYGECE